MEVLYHEPNGRCSRLTECNGILYFEPHIAAGCKDHEMSAKEQTAALLKRYEELLAKYGSDKHHIISVNVIMRDASMIGEINEAWEEWIDQGFQPPRLLFVGLSSPEYIKLNMTMVAAKIDA